MLDGWTDAEKVALAMLITFGWPLVLALILNILEGLGWIDKTDSDLAPM